MANTKVTGGVIADGAITAAKIASGALDSIIGGYLTTNTYATESYVTTAVNNLIDAAPASLDTLNELAAALNDDANFATTVTNSLATKLNLSGGTLTGNLIVDTNIGIGTTPATSTWPSLQFRNGNGITAFPTTNIPAVYFTSNAVYDGSFKYSTSNPAWITEMDAYNNAFAVKSAVSGTAGNAISWLERFRINSSGNVGIGTSSPSGTYGKLSVAGGIRILDDNNAKLEIGRYSAGASNSYIKMGANSNSLRFTDHNDQFDLVTIQNNGNVGIGTSSIGANSALLVSKNNGYLSVNSNIGAGGATNPSYDNGIHFGFNRSNGFAEANIVWGSPSGFSGHLEIGSWSGTAYTERMRITSGGIVLIGTTSEPSGSVSGVQLLSPLSGATKFSSAPVTTTAYVMQFYNGNGLVGYITTNGSSTNYVTSSDYRLKENIVEITGALDRVDALKPCRFNFITDPDRTVDGFIAHEVADVVPEAITGEKDAVDEEGNPVYQGIDQSKLVPLLVGAIKELKAEIETLKSQINA